MSRVVDLSRHKVLTSESSMEFEGETNVATPHTPVVYEMPSSSSATADEESEISIQSESSFSDNESGNISDDQSEDSYAMSETHTDIVGIAVQSDATESVSLSSNMSQSMNPLIQGNGQDYITDVGLQNQTDHLLSLGQSDMPQWMNHLNTVPAVTLPGLGANSLLTEHQDLILEMTNQPGADIQLLRRHLSPLVPMNQPVTQSVQFPFNPTAPGPTDLQLSSNPHLLSGQPMYPAQTDLGFKQGAINSLGEQLVLPVMNPHDINQAASSSTKSKKKKTKKHATEKGVKSADYIHGEEPNLVNQSGKVKQRVTFEDEEPLPSTSTGRRSQQCGVIPLVRIDSEDSFYSVEVGSAMSGSLGEDPQDWSDDQVVMKMYRKNNGERVKKRHTSKPQKQTKLRVHDKQINEQGVKVRFKEMDNSTHFSGSLMSEDEDIVVNNASSRHFSGQDKKAMVARLDLGRTIKEIRLKPTESTMEDINLNNGDRKENKSKVITVQNINHGQRPHQEKGNIGHEELKEHVSLKAGTKQAAMQGQPNAQSGTEHSAMDGQANGTKTQYIGKLLTEHAPAEDGTGKTTVEGIVTRKAKLTKEGCRDTEPESMAEHASTESEASVAKPDDIAKLKSGQKPVTIVEGTRQSQLNRKYSASLESFKLAKAGEANQFEIQEMKLGSLNPTSKAADDTTDKENVVKPETAEPSQTTDSTRQYTLETVEFHEPVSNTHECAGKHGQNLETSDVGQDSTEEHSGSCSEDVNQGSSSQGGGKVKNGDKHLGIMGGSCEATVALRRKNSQQKQLEDIVETEEPESFSDMIKEDEPSVSDGTSQEERSGDDNSQSTTSSVRIRQSAPCVLESGIIEEVSSEEKSVDCTISSTTEEQAELQK
ncbi:serine-rich adhesin for platelets-like [Haliotis asinina]|uniref:serine-rich adhesin for platelets-like n=1 Tax=Haliotis asinina TaxID=109174 RepID=UPI003531B6A7